MHSHSKLELIYRPEIDGLRSIAIIPILLFHFGFSLFSGGYTGVDIFFVISGYLITNVIVNRLSQNRFTFQDFYLRRAKRILPLLFVVLFTTIPFSWLLMFPPELSNFGDSLLHATSFTANIYFRHIADYFAPSSDQIPLLHIWSLAVEEQFYFVFPITLITLYKYKINFIKFFLIAILISLTLCLLGSNFPAKNFYWLPTRVWEFLFGALAFKLEKKIVPQNPQIKDLFGLIGLGLISFGIFILNDQTPFPGIYTLPTILGTFLLIIFAQKDTRTANLLSISPLRFIGKISYSLYLWHFPILVFSNFLHLRYSITINQYLLILTTLLISIPSYFYIETPLRFNKFKDNSFVVGLIALFLVLLFLGYSIKNFTSFYKKYNPQQAHFLEISAQKNPNPSFNQCNENEITKPCTISQGNWQHEAVLIGDSHAFTLFHPLSNELQKKKIKLNLQLKGNCPPIYTTDKKYLSDKCLARNQKVFEKIANDQDIETIIIFSRWSWYLEGTPFDNREGGVGEKSNHFLRNMYSNLDERHKLIQSLYINTFEFLAKTGKKIIVVNTAPEPGWNVPYQILTTLNSAKEYSELFYDYDLFKQRNYNVDTVFSAYKKNDHNKTIKVIDTSNLFCDQIQNTCRLTQNKIPLYSDDNHLSEMGSSIVAREIVELM